MRGGIRFVLIEFCRNHVLPIGNEVANVISTLCASLSTLERQDVVFYLRITLGNDDHPN